MSVNGGRPGWVRVVGFAAAVSVLGFIGTACGSRTSMLDADAYATDGEGLGSSAGRASVPGTSTGGKTGGTGLLGRAGSGSTTPVGGPASGVDTTLALTPCQQYCPGYGTQCRSRLDGQDCLTTCQGELNGFGPSCQTLGINALRCLTPFFNANGGDCNAAVNRALAQCGMIVAAFDSCKKTFSGTPTTSKPSSRFSSCKRSAGPGSTNCKESFSCNDGTYAAFCQFRADSMLLDCGCVNPNNEVGTGFLPPSGDICLDATTLCP